MALESSVKVFPSICILRPCWFSSERSLLKFMSKNKIPHNFQTTILETFFPPAHHSRQENLKLGYLALTQKKKKRKTNSSVLNAVCLQQLLFHTSGINPDTLSLAKRLGLGQLSWSETRAWEKAKEREKKREAGREKEWESHLAGAACRRGDSWWQRRIRGWREGGMDVVLSHRPPLWPRRSGLRTGRLTKAFGGSRAENKMQTATPRSVVSRQWPALKIGTGQNTQPEGLEEVGWGGVGSQWYLLPLT